jgi:hypothetical protein
MNAPPDFIRLQYAFAAHIRDPQTHPVPAGLEARRMQVYCDLFFNNLRGLLGTTFPVMSKLLGEHAWTALCRDFFARHHAQTPLFPQIPGEFVRYLEQRRGNHPGDPPFLHELAHYEWVELALSIDPREAEGDGIDPDGDLLAGRPRLSPLAWPLAYGFPVHRIGPDFQPAQAPAQPTYLLVYRDRRDQIGFIELNPVSALLLQKLQDGRTLNGAQILREIAEEIGHPAPETVVSGGLEILRELREKDVLLGAAPRTAG